MRVQLINTSNLSKEIADQTFLQLLNLYFSKNSASIDFILVDYAPDIVHVVGDWSWKTYRFIRRYRKLFVPVIFTCADGLQSIAELHQPTLVMKKIARAVSTIHTNGNNEQKIIEKWFPQTTSKLILNPLLTSKTNDSHTLEALCTLYNKVSDENDRRVKIAIETSVKSLKDTDEIINSICHKILYTHYYYKRGFLPLIVLQNLTDVLYTHDFDEKKLAERLKTLNMTTFTSQLMHVMNESTGLTEGFMPITEAKDKQGKRMTSMVLSVKDHLWLA